MTIKTKPSEQDKTSTATRRRTSVFARGAVAAAVALALAGAGFLPSIDAHATMPPPQSKSVQAFSGPASFADILQQVSPAVVNIAVIEKESSGQVQGRVEIPQIPEDSPLGQFFRRHFGQDGAPWGHVETPRRVEALGSGFIIDPSGWVVTNNHVVDGAARVKVIMQDGTQYKAQVKGRDPKTDLALLKVDAGKPLPYVQFGDSDTARVGDWVLAVGNPFGLGGSVTAGIISARGRDINSGPYDDFLQVDAPINRGNSGGPLFNEKGRVIGVNTAIYSPSGGSVGIGFAIPSSIAKDVVSKLEATGHIERGWLGVAIQPVTEDVAKSLGLSSEQGTLVASVAPDSPAAKAGLRPGDVILQAGGKPIDEFKDLSRLVADTPAGTNMKIEVYRDGKTKDLPVVIGKMPDQQKVAARQSTQPDDTTPHLGLYLAPITPQARRALQLGESTQGALVAQVEQGSPADEAGIKPGSVISMVGQQATTTPHEVEQQVHAALDHHHSSVLLRVEQNGQQRFVVVRLAA
ncbi:MAG: DegQ family serine endoprotease [Chromatiaceae bacterium]|jgi:serine protease Do